MQFVSVIIWWERGPLHWKRLLLFINNISSRLSVFKQFPSTISMLSWILFHMTLKTSIWLDHLVFLSSVLSTDLKITFLDQWFYLPYLYKLSRLVHASEPARGMHSFVNKKKMFWGVTKSKWNRYYHQKNKWT